MPKISLKRANLKNKKLLLSVTAVVLVVALGAGIWLGAGGKAEPVGVYAFMDIGMTEYWGDSQESYGPVTTDRIQTVFLSDTQTVTEVLVAQGDMVKKGDVLLRFDTTLSELELERKRLEVEKLKLDLEDAKAELNRIASMKPMETPIFDEPTIDEDINTGSMLMEAYRISNNPEYNGSSQELALICWLQDTTNIDSSVLEAIRQRAEELQNMTVEPTEPETTEEPTAETTEETTEETIEETTQETVEEIPEEPIEETPEEPIEETPEEPAEETPEEPVEETPEEPVEETPEEPVEETPEEPVEEVPEEPAEEITEDGTQTTTEDTTQTIVEEVSQEDTQAEMSQASDFPEEGGDEGYISVDSYYVIFKITQGNMSLGQRTVWQGAHVYGWDGSFSIRLFDASGMMDYTLIDDGEEDPGGAEIPDIDFGSGYTAAQIAQMRAEQEKKIKDLEFKIKMADADYKIMQTEVGDGNIYADIDGEVVSLLTEEEAKQSKTPFMKVSGGGGFYVEGSINELEKDNLRIGQEVTINDWESGMTYTGTVQSIGDFPSRDNGYSGMGNPNSSYYPFVAFVDGSADLQAGKYVSMTFATSTGANGIYLQNPFVRTENGESYVYVQGAGGKLEKRTVTVGKSLWGSYTEIKGGLSEDDYIAFPYGKDVKPGAPTELSDLSSLYSY